MKELTPIQQELHDNICGELGELRVSNDDVAVVVYKICSDLKLDTQRYNVLDDDQKFLFGQLWDTANDGVIPSSRYLEEVFDALSEFAKNH